MKCGTRFTKGRTCKSDKIYDDARPFYNEFATLQVAPKFGRISTTSQTWATLSFDGFKKKTISRSVVVFMVDILKARSRKWK